MRTLFDQVRVDGTAYMNNPLDVQKQNHYLYSMSQWAEAGINNLSVPIDYYQGYQFSFSVFDGSGCLIYGSDSPTLKIVSESNGIYTLTTTTLKQTYDVNNYEFVPSVSSTNLYKICNDYVLLPFANQAEVVDSDFIINQLSLPETMMAVSSLLVDSANTRTFGVPKYGFSNRSNQLQVAGVAYYCAHVVDIYSVPDANGDTTLIETIFVRIALEENGPPLSSITNQNLSTNDLIQQEEETLSWKSPKYKMLNKMLSAKNF